MSPTKYSLTKGLVKGLTWALTAAGSFLIISGYADVSVWDLVEKYLKPVVGTLTLGTFVTMVINYLKVRSTIRGFTS